VWNQEVQFLVEDPEKQVGGAMECGFGGGDFWYVLTHDLECVGGDELLSLDFRGMGRPLDLIGGVCVRGQGLPHI
jgi:hypothetical protein